MRFNRNKPDENLKRVEGKVTHIAPIFRSEAMKSVVSISVTLQHKILRKTYSTDNAQMATTVYNFIHRIGMQVYLTLDEKGEITGCGVVDRK